MDEWGYFRLSTDKFKLIELMVSPDGLEPSTHSLKGNCSTNWAKGPQIIQIE